ncbi:MAG: hypothetical protein WD533_08995 [Dehalococcoidia bacterium]
MQSFRNSDQAGEAVRSLLEAGFSPNAISVAAGARHKVALQAYWTGDLTHIPEAGVVSAGPLLTLLVECAKEDSPCSLSKALRLLGVDRQLASHYRRQAEAGEIVVIATANTPTVAPQPVRST